MSGRLLVLVAVLLGFGVLSGVALADAGYWGIVKPHFESWGGAQVFADLAILCAMACVWMVLDGRKRSTGRIPAWPFVALTLVAGSFGPLLYLLAREWRSAPGR